MDFLEKNKEIGDLANFKIPTKTKYFFEINNLQDVKKLKQINDFAKKNNLKILFLASGTNIFFAFEEFNGIIIKNNLKGFSYDKNSKILEAYSQELISDLAQELEEKHNNNLWHRFIGLPGSIGGAIYGNAGCFGLETENNFLKALVYDIGTGEQKEFFKTDVNFSYRNSIFKENGQRYFIIKAWFDLSKKIEKYSSQVDNLYFREHKQPKGFTCGSFFKNPSKEFSAGYLIEQVGLKAKNISGAYFSEIHANFLMNDGTATYKDILNMIELAQKKVKQEFNIDLIPEVRIIKN